MAEAYELFALDGNGHLGPVGVNLECLVVYLEHGMVHLMYSLMDINQRIGYQGWRIIFDYFLLRRLQQHRHLVILRIRP